VLSKGAIRKTTMANFFSAQWRRWTSAMGLALTGLALAPLMVWAQLSPVVRDQFLSDPELTEPRDPLLPEVPVLRPLSPLEKSALAEELSQLAAAAEALYLAGDTEQAFQTWIREVRLRRILGYEAEIAAMQRVGLRAWEASRSDEIQLLTLRLQQIQAELLAATPLNIRLLEEVAATFEVLRDVDSAIAVYETLIVRAAQAGNTAERRRLLENLARLQESWFRFDVAGKTYQSLLSCLGGSGDPLKEVQYLQGAVRNYQEAGELRIAIDFQRRLLQQYQETAQVQPIPALTLAIARNYRALDDLAEARNFYLTTYSTALAQQQTNIASEALQDLAAIYLALGKTDDVLYLYEQRLAVERLSYDGYGLMQVFDDLGRLYEAQNNWEAAIAAYKEALILANHLDYRAAYFKNRLQRLLLAQGRVTVPPAEQHQDSRTRPLENPANVWEAGGASAREE
jgi:tetratricopeptide (TPR) repeat protein